MAKDWLLLELDVDRMKGGKAVEKRLAGGKQHGYPWLVTLDGDAPGEVALADSIGPNGNIGCPVTEEEAAVFFDMLRKTRTLLTDAELEVLRAEQAAFAKPILEAMRR